VFSLLIPFLSTTSPKEIPLQTEQDQPELKITRDFDELMPYLLR